MNYTICEMDSFSVIGQKIELTNRQKENIKICVEFWREFNNNLKKAYLLQSGNWIKYAFMERREDRLFYLLCNTSKNSSSRGICFKRNCFMQIHGC